MTTQASATGKNRRLLWITFGLTFTFFVVEVVGGILTNSLALLADAAHMLTDVGGLGLALFAAWMSSKPATPARTYGYYRVEILAAMINAGVLLTGALRHTRLPRVQGRVEEIVSAVPSSSRWNALKRHRRVGPRPVGQ